MVPAPRRPRGIAPILCLLAGLAGPLAAQEAFAVRIVTAQRQPVATMVTIVGTVEAANAYPLAFRSGGQVTQVEVETGDHVPAGGVIARVDPASAEAQAAASRAALGAAEARLRQAEQERDRAQGLLDRGTGTQSDLDNALEAFVSARSARDGAQAQLEIAEQAVEDTVLRAPEAVTVLERSVDPGEVVGAGAQVAQVASEGRLEAVFQAPDVAGLAEMRGTEAELTPEGRESFTAAVTEVSPVVDASGTVAVRAAIPEDVDPAPTIGTLITGRVPLPSEQLVTVPWSALTADADGPAVWTVDPETMRVQLTQVTLGRFTDADIGVTEGLADGTQVVAEGGQFLFPGREVTPLASQEDQE
ncbi:efflux RND transporter periplasmic adaptor subunit [Pseudoroseicyclus aestuarii]|uniref:RND family efflux transporter MFP subunit n=1 Tax=Pseudoroseicyclus aestuarii TaxID=1795041 RepID=A0A318SNF1_9RHOB|nr:efflux RND transporter periplasmic adaptor subunit [Pseudoroseicyclus aestuarii]PYE82343.1 RND family efflux transporter MFP subunit [Pseudoroseicyclus aestuarii]